MKTTMQEVNKMFLELNPEEFYGWFWNNKDLLLKIEKLQICRAYAIGGSDSLGIWEFSEDYYNETFKNEGNEKI